MMYAAILTVIMRSASQLHHQVNLDDSETCCTRLPGMTFGDSSVCRLQVTLYSAAHAIVRVLLVDSAFQVSLTMLLNIEECIISLFQVQVQGQSHT